ncbi:snake venom metalloprotease inhibitor 02A10-like [Anabas testudineus]|uniref:snake venom metalloprotease inhibitor 02A10-like n=1 Tax=Anabas testudineus TaxID=64144 RepID=UPI000E45A063|nr:snake venom metalloprotease inhibitor 02A10-like [Anabas testudineus]
MEPGRTNPPLDEPSSGRTLLWTNPPPGRTLLWTNPPLDEPSPWTNPPLDEPSPGRTLPWTNPPLDEPSPGRTLPWTNPPSSTEHCTRLTIYRKTHIVQRVASLHYSTSLRIQLQEKS